MNMLRVFLADDHELVREGLRALVNSQPDMECVGEAADGRAAVERVQSLRPDVAVLDVSMPGLNGLEAAKKLKHCCPDVRLLTLTRHTDDGYLQQLLKAGVSGYVLKQSASSVLLTALRAVAVGNLFLDPAITGKVIGNYVGKSAGRGASTGGELSERESEVLRLIAWGYSNKEIGWKLNISSKTVDTYKLRLMEKLSLRSRTDIVRYALRQGLLQEE